MQQPSTSAVLLPQPVSDNIIPKSLHTAPHPAHFADYILYVDGHGFASLQSQQRHAPQQPTLQDILVQRIAQYQLQPVIYVQDVHLLSERKPWMQQLPVLVSRHTKYAYVGDQSLQEIDRYIGEVKQSNKQILLPPASDQPVTSLTETSDDWGQATGSVNTCVNGQEFVLLKPPTPSDELLGAPILWDKTSRVDENHIRAYLQLRNATAPPHARQTYWPGLSTTHAASTATNNQSSSAAADAPRGHTPHDPRLSQSFAPSYVNMSSPQQLHHVQQNQQQPQYLEHAGNVQHSTLPPQNSASIDTPSLSSQHNPYAGPQYYQEGNGHVYHEESTYVGRSPGVMPHTHAGHVPVRSSYHHNNHPPIQK